MIKINKRLQKFIAILLLVITTCVSVPISSFAKYLTNINSNAVFGAISGSFSTYKHELHYATYDGTTYITFCTQSGIKSPSGKDYVYNDEFQAQINKDRANYEKIAEYIYFGYTMKHGIGLPSTTEAKRDACATQQFVWEYIYNNITKQYSCPSRDSWNPTYMSSSIYNSWLSETENHYKQYHEKNVSFNGITTEIEIGGTKTITDSNGVFSSYPTFSENINGITFQHTYGSNDIVIKSDKNSNFTSAKLKTSERGIYKLLPNGHTYNSYEMSSYIYFEFPSSKIQDLIFSNYVDPEFFSLNVNVQSSKIQIKKTDNTGNSIKGCQFKLYSDASCTNEIATGITDNNGLINFDKINSGTYYIRECKVPTGYLIDNTVKQIDIKPGEIVTVNFKNNEPTGKILIYKTNNNGEAIANAEFTVKAAETIKNKAGTKKYFNKGDIVEIIKSNEETGIASIAGLPMGKYEVQESKAPTGYLINNAKYEVVLEYKDETTSEVEVEIKDVINVEPTGTISIIKKDSETGSTPQGDATLLNAKYDVYANEDIYNKAKTKKYYSKGDLIATRSMNEDGTTADITDLPLGKYIVKETVASKGYLIDTKKYEVNLEYKDQNTKIISETITSYEDVKKMQVHIFKSGIKENSGLVKGLEGAEFTIKLNSDVEKAYSLGYSYTEVWNGIDEYGNKVNVNKDRVTEAQKIAPTYETITTDKDGNAYTQEKLPYGKYIVKETVTPKDFESAVDFTFSITEDESEVKEVAKKVKHLDVNNEQLETYLKIIKKDLTSNKTVSLNSTTFQIIAAKDIYDRGTGKIIYKKGEIIKQKVGSTTYSTFTTNADNLVVPAESYNSKNDNKGSVTTPLLLPVGNYELKEIKVPEGFLQLENPITFKIEAIRDYDTDKDGDYIKEITVKNEQPTGTLIIDKSVILRQNANTSLIDTSDLSSIEFSLVAKENIIDMTDGSIIYKKGKEVKKVNLNKDGNAEITKLPLGCYELYETKTLEGLVLNKTKYEVKFTQKDQITKVYEETKEIENKTTIVEFSKQDITGEKELVGAKLTVKDENNKVIDTWTSTETTHKIEGLIIGKTYTLIEEIAPDNYVKATEVKFKVKDTAEIQTVKMIDKIVEMSKVDIGGNEIEGAKIKVYDKEGKIVDEWTSTKETHKIKNLIEGDTYTLHEEYAPEGYVIATDIEFTVSKDKKTQKIEMIDKVVEMSKVDIGGEELEGATIIVTNKKTKNIVDKWISGRVPHKIQGLIEGETYILHEEIQVEGYVKATDIEFTVSTDKETQKVKMIDKIVLISKTDLVTGEELPGAELIVTDKDGNLIDRWISTNEPHQVVGLEEGQEYLLTEITNPYGYEIAETITFKVTLDKETQLVEMKDMPILKTVKVLKLDSDTQEVIKSKFKFGIYEDAECTKLIKEVESNIDEGTAEFKDLRYGTYYIKETEAPVGYYLSDKIVKIEVNENGVFADEKELEEKDEAYCFEYFDTLIPTIQTGTEVNNILLVSLIIISIIVIILGLFFLRKNN